MTKPKQKGFTGKEAKKSNAGRIWMGIVGVALVGLIAVGMSTVFQRPSAKTGDVVAVDAAEPDAASAAVVVDRETTYLGPNSDPTALARAETGTTGHPTLVMFHADW